ncbi:MAG: adenylyltransferase/cytidyltransferase family protein [Candidatus Anstonellaceae archaeon]
MYLESLKKLCLKIIENNGLDEEDFLKLNSEHRAFLQKIGSKYFLKSEYRKMLKIVLTGGVFDIIHPGHLYTLEQAKKYGDLLIVVVATDQTVKKIKKRDPLHPQKLRIQLLKALKIVDLVIAGKKNWLEVLNQVKPDVVVFGYDQPIKDIPGVKLIKLKKFLKFQNSKTGKIRKMLGI